MEQRSGKMFGDLQLSVAMKMTVWEVINVKLFELQSWSYLKTSHLHPHISPSPQTLLSDVQILHHKSMKWLDGMIHAVY